MPIPDTVVCEDTFVRHIYTDKNGCVTIQKMNIERPKREKEEFVARVLERCLDNSVPIMDDSTDVYNRVIGVYKQPNWRTHVTNNCETLTPIGMVAHLLDSVHGSSGSCILQKYIKNRGRTSCIYRIFWKKTSDETNFDRGNIIGWNVSNVDYFKMNESKRNAIHDIRRR